MKANKAFLLLFFLFSVSSHAQNWQWAKQVGGNNSQSTDFANVVTDGTNSYLVGWYSGSIHLLTDTLYSNGTSDLFVIMYDSNGNEVWAKGFGGNGNGLGDFESAYAKFDPVSNNIYLSGTFAGMMILGTDTLNSFPDELGLYVCKMDLNGNFIWANSINNSTNHGLGFFGDAEVFCSPKGIIYLTGTMLDTITICGTTILPGGFLVKYDSNGSCLLVRNLFSNVINRVEVNFIDNDLILSGSFYDTIFNLDTATILNHGIGTPDFYISRADTNGNITWLDHFGYGGSDGLGSINVNPTTDEIYLCGGFQDSISINGIKLYNSGRDILFCKLDGNGNTIWAKQTNATISTGFASCLKIDTDGNFYTVGTFTGNATFGTYSISSSNSSEMFMVRYNSNGDCLGVRHFGYASGMKVEVDNNGNPICSGAFQNTVTIGSNTFTSNGFNDIYLAKSDIFTGLGEEKSANSNQLIIYANPNKGTFNIKVPDEVRSLKNARLLIYDTRGKEIANFSLEKGHSNFVLPNPSTGNYTVKLIQNTKTYLGKMIVE